MKKKAKKNSNRFNADDGELLSLYIKGAGGKGFTMSVVGPGKVCVVREKKKKDKNTAI